MILEEKRRILEIKKRLHNNGESTFIGSHPRNGLPISFLNMRSLYIIQQTDHGLPSDAWKVKKYWEGFKYDLTDFSVKGVWLLPKTARSEEPLPPLRTDCCSARFKQVQNSI